MINITSQTKGLVGIALGAAVLSLAVLWLWSSQTSLLNHHSAVLDHPFAVALCVASLIAASWALVRCRDREDSARTSRDKSIALVDGVSDHPSADGMHPIESAADEDLSLRMLVRIGFGALAALLIGLVIGDLLSVVYALAITGVVIAFLFIVAVVPRGL